MLKLAHAVGLHGIAVLPGLAWLSGYAGWPPSVRRSVLRTGTVGYLGVLAGALWVGARGELTSVTVFGIALAGSVLVSAVFRVLLALRAGKRVVSESIVR